MVQGVGYTTDRLRLTYSWSLYSINNGTKTRKYNLTNDYIHVQGKFSCKKFLSKFFLKSILARDSLFFRLGEKVGAKSWLCERGVDNSLNIWQQQKSITIDATLLTYRHNSNPPLVLLIHYLVPWPMLCPKWNSKYCHLPQYVHNRMRFESA